MNHGKAMAIFLQINSEEFTDEEKAEAIYIVMNMATHMSIKKDNMIEVIKWLWNQKYEWIEEDEEKAGESVSIVKKCPVCGNEPMNYCYTSNPPLYGYSCCDVHGGYNKDWHEAKNKWNEAVEKRSNNNA